MVVNQYVVQRSVFLLAFDANRKPFDAIVKRTGDEVQRRFFLRHREKQRTELEVGYRPRGIGEPKGSISTQCQPCSSTVVLRSPIFGSISPYPCLGGNNR